MHDDYTGDFYFRKWDGRNWGMVKALFPPSLSFRRAPCGDPLTGFDGLGLAIPRNSSVTVRPGEFVDDTAELRAALYFGAIQRQNDVMFLQARFPAGDPDPPLRLRPPCSSLRF